MPGPGLHRFSVLLAVCTFLLVAAGATVVSKEAGLSVPDWPLSYGKVMPPMTGGVLYEHGHRMIATTVGLLTVILCVWLWLKDDRRWMKWLGTVALLAVIAQGVLGGLTVLYLLPKAVSVGHACLAQLFFATTVAIAIFTSPSWHSGAIYVKDQGWPSMRSLAWISSGFVLAQIALGAAYRHQAIDVIPHVVGAFVTALVTILTASFAWSQYGHLEPMKRAAQALISVTGLQLVLGLLALMSRINSEGQAQPELSMVILTVLHTAAGGLVLASSCALSIQILRNVHPALLEPAAAA